MAQERSNPGRDMVVVLETSDRIQSAMAKGLLDDAGIPVYISGEIVTLLPDLDPFLHKRVRLLVPRSCEAEARKILEQFHGPVPLDADGEV
jgi:Putative prokaryotic signal transducing protein